MSVCINNTPNNIRTIAVRNTYHFRFGDFNRYIRLLFEVMLTFYTHYSYISVYTVHTYLLIHICVIHCNFLLPVYCVFFLLNTIYFDDSKQKQKFVVLFSNMSIFYLYGFVLPNKISIFVRTLNVSKI